MKLKQCILFLCCLFVANLFFAQSSTLNGRVYHFDSKNEDGDVQYVEGANISSPYSNKKVKSDLKGRFSFKLDGHRKGEPIQLRILKDGYEVVNQKDVDNAEPNKTYTLRIFLTPKGEMVNLRNNLMRVANNHVSSLKEQVLDSIAFGGIESQMAITNLEKQSGQKIYNALEAEELLYKMNNHLEEQLPDYIYYLSKINPDFASKMFKRAFNSYKDGNITKAVESIDEGKLAKGVNHIKSVLEEIKSDPSKKYKMISLRAKTLSQIKDSYLLKIIALQQSFQFVEANKVLQRLTKIAQLDPVSNDVGILEILKVPNLATMSVENVDMVLSEKGKVKEDEIDYSTKDIFNEKGNADAAKKDISIISQIGQEPQKDNNTLTDEEAKSPADAEAHDFENTLFIPEETSSQLVTILNREKQVGAGSAYPSKQPIVVTREVIRPSTTPAPPVVNIQRTPVVISTPEPVVIDKRSYISVEEIVPMREEVKASEEVRKANRRYTRQTVTKRTSLRKLPTASSKVLKRLAVGTNVQVIEQVNKYWCRVLLNGREGYVKAFLLER